MTYCWYKLYQFSQSTIYKSPKILSVSKDTFFYLHSLSTQRGLKLGDTVIMSKFNQPRWEKCVWVGRGGGRGAKRGPPTTYFPSRSIWPRPTIRSSLAPSRWTHKPNFCFWNHHSQRIPLQLEILVHSFYNQTGKVKCTQILSLVNCALEQIYSMSSERPVFEQR